MLITECEKIKPPEAPNPVSPAEIMENDTVSVTFIWQAVDEAESYALEIAEDKEFQTTVLVDSNINNTSYTVDAGKFEELKFYYWRVAACNEEGWSDWSSTARFYYVTTDWVISPEDSTIFEFEPPVLLWHSYPEATDYVIRICRDSFDIYHSVLEDTIKDTSYRLPESIWIGNPPGTYKWAVLMLGTYESLVWTKPRTFITRMMPDLDTTYFPFGLGYEWRYSRHSWQHVSEPGWDEYDRYDTFTLSVADSFWVGDTLRFQSTGGVYNIVQNTIDIFGESIKLIPDPMKKEVEAPWYWGEFEVSYTFDTLHVSLWGPDPYDEGSESWGSTRIIGVGAIAQGRSYSGYSCGVYFSNGYSDRLLWFYNGADTLYRAPDWGEVIDIDLDTTYFPMGLGYEWTYQRHSWGEEQSGDSTITWDEYDTFTVSVSDSFWEGNKMMISFEADTSKPFHDLDDPASVMDGRILVQMWAGVTPWLNPYQPETNWPLNIKYYGDTLKISHGDAAPGGDPYYSYYQEWTARLRNIGPVLQGTSYYNYDSGDVESYTRDSLISFKTPQYQFRLWIWR